MNNPAEVRDFLTTRRAKITPERAGLPDYGGHRRVTGLRREEVALLAGVSVDYYTRLEQNSDARPAIVDPPASLDGYDTVLLGSPIWNVRPPMIMSTFTEAYDFTDTTVLPLVTYAVSGLGRTVEIYTASCRGATFGEALAVRGEEVADSRAAVDAWLRRVGLTR